VESDPLSLELPWMNYKAIRWLSRHARNAAVFEWGSGGSTLYLAPLVASLVSIEHDAAWHKVVGDRIRSETCTLRLVPPVPGPPCPNEVPQGYRSSRTDFSQMNFERYCQTIRDYSDESFNVVIVDGRARGSCIHEALPKVKPGGWLVLDDSDRAQYATGIGLLGGWKRMDFHGPKPGDEGSYQTSVFRRPL